MGKLAALASVLPEFAKEVFNAQRRMLKQIFLMGRAKKYMAASAQPSRNELACVTPWDFLPQCKASRNVGTI